MLFKKSEIDRIKEEYGYDDDTAKDFLKELDRWSNMSPEEREEEMNESVLDIIVDVDYDDMPEGCKSCGGPWPDCETSCVLFD